MPRHHHSATAAFRLALIGIVSWVLGGLGMAVAQSLAEHAVATAGGMPTGITFAPDGDLRFTANNRIFVEFSDASGTVRGSTSVAVGTQ
jgi:hypothetical protein